jgi:hypothetical protein
MPNYYGQITTLATELKLELTKVSSNNWLIAYNGTSLHEKVAYNDVLSILKKYQSGEFINPSPEVPETPALLQEHEIEPSGQEEEFVAPAPELPETSEPTETAKKQSAPKVKFVEVYERYSPKNKDLLRLTTSTLKDEVLESLSLKNAAQAAKWAKSQGMNGIDLCYKAHWAALVEKVREYKMEYLNDQLDGVA